VVLFLVLWIYARKPRPELISGLFLFCWVFRFTVELVREPDAQLGYLAFNHGTTLSLP
jgi:phosphatidylglycerol:prolipoprotein diacylglycerol transferase